MVYFTRLLLTELSLATSLASAFNCTSLPQATVQNGTYTGVYSPEYDQEYFLGIPFAQVRRMTYTPSTSW